jgi:hypothetical protein
MPTYAYRVMDSEKSCHYCRRGFEVIQRMTVRKTKWGTSYIVPVKRGNEKILSFIKTASYKTLLILGTLFPLNPMTDLP